MRITRSASASAGIKRPASPLTLTSATFTSTKATTTAPTTAVKRAKTIPCPPSAAPPPPPPAAATEVDDSEAVLLHPQLTFSYSDAKHHLSQVDTRWATLMNKMKCGPFEFDPVVVEGEGEGEGEGEAEQKAGHDQSPFNPFRSLVSSIIGQQVSWLAARSIQHKFTRLFFPHLPEKRAPPTPSSSSSSSSKEKEDDSPFPTPSQVLLLAGGGTARTAALRGAGLSGRKVEYIVELAERFHDGRLKARGLWEMSDEEVTKELVAVRGIGIWTVHMFQIFSLKRPNICPVGDLGIQKALCRWYSDDPNADPTIHKRKLQTAAIKEEEEEEERTNPNPSTSNPFVFPPTSNNLTPAILRSRLGGKKLKGNLYLTPLEMQELMAQFEPFRSIACWYLWSVVDGTGDP